MTWTCSPPQRGSQDGYPGRAELTSLQSLREQAHARTVEVQHLRSAPVATHEEIHVPGKHVVTHVLDHQGSQRVERLTHVAWLVERKHADASRQPDHASRLRSSATP